MPPLHARVFANRSLAVEYADRGVGVNYLCPGHVTTELAPNSAAAPRTVAGRPDRGPRRVTPPISRPGTPAEIATMGGLPPTNGPAAHLGVLGQTGLTAYVGLLEIAALRGGETVFVSAAAGAVGSVAGQIAKAMGCTVIGSAGSSQKVATLTDRLGFDAAFDRSAGPIRAELDAALVRAGVTGIDVYFDNVGGEQLEAAIRKMHEGGRLALCGAIATYNATEPVPGPRNLLLLIWRRLRMEGFLVTNHLDRRADFERDMLAWLRSGAVTGVETLVEGGIERAWDAFTSMMDGGNVGKTVVVL